MGNKQRAFLCTILLLFVAAAAGAQGQDSARPVILVSNDDGFDAQGIKALISGLRPIGEIRVSPPAGEYSGVGHGLTLRSPIMVKERKQSGGETWYAVEGHGVLDTEKFNILRTLSFFKSFGDVELWEVLRFWEWVDIPKDQIIMKEGEPGDYFGILVAGEARVMRKHRLLSLLKAGECVGEMAYLGEAGNLRSADVVAATDVRTIKVSVSALERAS